MLRRSDRDPQHGYTFMLLSGPGKKARRIHVSRRTARALATTWAAAVLLAAWLGYASCGG